MLPRIWSAASPINAVLQPPTEQTSIESTRLANSTVLRPAPSLYYKILRPSQLTIRLSDAGLRQRQTELIYPNHRPPPWPTEDASSRARSSRLLGANTAKFRRAMRFVRLRAYSADAYLGKTSLPFLICKLRPYKAAQLRNAQPSASRQRLLWWPTRATSKFKLSRPDGND